MPLCYITCCLGMKENLELYLSWAAHGRYRLGLFSGGRYLLSSMGGTRGRQRGGLGRRRNNAITLVNYGGEYIAGVEEGKSVSGGGSLATLSTASISYH